MENYLNTMKNINFLTYEQEQDLGKKSNKGDMVAREKLIASHLKLVIKIAKHYQGHNLLFEDLVQEGNIGLIIAVDKFEPSKGVRLSTYAKQWIDEHIKRYVYKHVFAVNVSFKAAKRLFSEKNNNADIERKTNNFRFPVSLDKTEINNEEGQSIGNLIRDQRETASESCEKREIISILNKKIKYILDGRELNIIKKRFLNSEQKTYKELAKDEKISLETVRNIEKKSLNKLKNKLGELSDVI